MIIVHHLEQSRSRRVLWLLEELGVAYRVQHYKRDVKTSLAPSALMQVHPLGKSPVIEDGEVTLAETGAIVEYLIGKYGQGKLRPAPGSAGEVDYLYWLHFAEGTAMPPLVMSLVLGRMLEAPMPFFVKPVVRQVASRLGAVMVDRHLPLHLDHFERTLGSAALGGAHGGGDFLIGDTLTGADIMMSFPIEAASLRVNARDGRPNLAAWLVRIHARPAYGAALAKGGP